MRNEKYTTIANQALHEDTKVRGPGVEANTHRDSVKAGLWTMNHGLWTMDHACMDWTLDWNMDLRKTHFQAFNYGSKPKLGLG